MEYDDMRPEDLVNVELSGRVVEGRLKPSVDTTSHVAIYRARREVGAVVHTHSPYSTAFSGVRRAIPGLGRDRAILLPNHGVIAAGESVEKAFTAALLVEHSARVAILASLMGQPHLIPPGEVERMHRFIHQEYGQV